MSEIQLSPEVLPEEPDEVEVVPEPELGRGIEATTVARARMARTFLECILKIWFKSACDGRKAGEVKRLVTNEELMLKMGICK